MNIPLPKHLKIILLFLCTILTTILLHPSLTANPAPEQSKDTNKIVLGMSAAFKGPSKGLGIELYRGSLAYLDKINQAGGVKGKKIEIKTYDDSYNPVPTIHNTIELIEQDDVFLLFEYVGTPTVSRMLPLLKRYSDSDMYLFFPFTGAQPQREEPYDQFVFNLRSSYRQETAGLVDNFVKIGRKKIAVFYQIDAYGRSGWDGVKRALAQYDAKIVEEATYRRGTPYDKSFKKQVNILKQANPDAVISIGAYAACAAFIRDAREADWDVPIANVSFVGSENLLNLLLETGKRTGKDYTTNLINSQVVPSYEDTSLPAVQEYRQLMEKYQPLPPQELMEEKYQPLPYSFVSFEGFLNAKLLVEILKRMDNTPQRSEIKPVVEQIQNLDLGINAPVSFNSQKHQGLNQVYYTTVNNGKFVPLTDWSKLSK
ncbi:MAG: ABC transporter substrate-binding protein [Symploca sp. SIO1B1]|nr:ABC transporter substrate-binding protein [Symploca sp. SIO2D2]NER96354.1 ABC transporter substrate-binding protein [Symploca sp. SIO1B1]